MTPREVVQVMDGAAWRAEQEQQRLLYLAWHVAALQRVKRLPSLRHLLRPRRRSKPKSMAERRREYRKMKAAYHAHTARRSTDTD